MKILIADDESVSLRVLEIALKRMDYEVITAKDGVTAWDQLRADDQLQLAVIDWMMPGMDGPQLCREIRKLRPPRYVYVLLLTARGQKEDIIAGLGSGADDYLVKPVNAFELKARLDVGRRILDLQGQLLSAYEEMRQRAMHDALTGLLNRGAILEHLDHEWSRAQREKCPLGILMADLDHFKRINDTLGHPAGDAVLREAARRFRDALRTYDAVGRYGGEEFVIVTYNCSPKNLLGLAERLLHCIASSPIPFENLKIPVTLSVGASSQLPQALGCPLALLQEADAALYQAKTTGRNRVVLYSPATSKNDPSTCNVVN